jgi:hypothetical protein
LIGAATFDASLATANPSTPPMRPRLNWQSNSTTCQDFGNSVGAVVQCEHAYRADWSAKRSPGAARIEITRLVASGQASLELNGNRAFIEDSGALGSNSDLDTNAGDGGSSLTLAGALDRRHAHADRHESEPDRQYPDDGRLFNSSFTLAHDSGTGTLVKFV